jgi:hypothetical protein
MSILIYRGRSFIFFNIDNFLVNFVTILGLGKYHPCFLQGSQMSDGHKPPISPWAYASDGFQLAVTLLIGFYIGYRLDIWKETSPWFTVAGSALGIVAGLYNFLRRFLNK